MKRSRNLETSIYAIPPLFAKFLSPEDQIHEMASEKMDVPAGEVLRLQRLRQDGFYYVESGLLKLEIQNPAPRIIRICTAGEIVGFGHWLNPHRAKGYRIVAARPSAVQFWTKQAFQVLRDRHPEVNDLIIHQLCNTILHKDERIAALESVGVEVRVAKLLYGLARQFGRRVDEGLLIDIELDRDSMAQLAGTVAATFARVITTLEERKLVRRRRRQIIVVDAEKLAALA